MKDNSWTLQGFGTQLIIELPLRSPDIVQPKSCNLHAILNLKGNLIKRLILLFRGFHSLFYSRQNIVLTAFYLISKARQSLRNQNVSMRNAHHFGDVVDGSCQWAINISRRWLWHFQGGWVSQRDLRNAVKGLSCLLDKLTSFDINMSVRVSLLKGKNPGNVDLQESLDNLLGGEINFLSSRVIRLLCSDGEWHAKSVLYSCIC